MMYHRILISFFIWIISIYAGASNLEFQSPTNDSTTKGCDGKATSEFGEKRGKHFHRGIDISIISVCHEWH